MNKTKYVGFCTPVGFDKFKDRIDEIRTKVDIDITPTHHVYMNLMDPSWTSEKCDETLYVVERKYFETQSLILKDTHGES